MGTASGQPLDAKTREQRTEGLGLLMVLPKAQLQRPKSPGIAMVINAVPLFPNQTRIRVLTGLVVPTQEPRQVLWILR